MKQILLNKLGDRKLTKSQLMPLVWHSVIDKIPLDELYKLITEELEVGKERLSIRTLQRWRGEARDWLGLPKPKESSKERIAAWHRANGYPTLEALVNGWKPTTVDWENLPKNKSREENISKPVHKETKNNQIRSEAFSNKKIPKVANSKPIERVNTEVRHSGNNTAQGKGNAVDIDMDDFEREMAAKKKAKEDAKNKEREDRLSAERARLEGADY